MTKKWQLLSDKRLVISDKEAVVEVLLKNRGIKDREAFFNPPKPDYLITQLPKYLPDLDFDQLQKAVERIKSAIRQGRKIIVWGDFDVDGVTATAILWQALSALSAHVLPYIPDRFTEGYGLNKQGIRQLADQGVKLIVTVDSGITAKDEVEYANSLGIEVIVTDHHLEPEELPPAYAIVHTNELCGAGVAWLLSALLRRSNLGDLGDLSNLSNLSNLSRDLDLVAIATVADLQPLLGANRSLVKHGFEVLNQNKRPGLAALLEVAGLKPGNLGSYAAGWILGPRINAIGRLKQGIEALRLLCTQDEIKARELAHLLEATNIKRQSLTEEIYNHAKGLVTDGSASSPQGEGLIVLYHDSWHEGIIGLVAGRLVEEYGRPAVVIAKGEEFSKGSARSVNGFNLLEALQNHADLLEDVGGHEMAAGFTVLNEKLERFVSTLKAEAKEKLKKLDPRPILKIDAELPLQNLSYELVAELEKFKPHGVGNPEPLFLAQGVNVLEERKVGRQKQHLKLLVSPGFEAIWFGHGENGSFTLGEEVSLAYTPEIEVWNGKEKVTLKIRDLRRAGHD